MKCCDILNFYKRSDLNRLAKNKIANYAGLPVEILRDELSKALHYLRLRKEKYTIQKTSWLYYFRHCSSSK